MRTPALFSNKGKEMNLFKGKTAIVTGGASGIGLALCEQLSEQGAKVTIADINKEGAESAEKKILASGGTAQAAYLDVTSSEAVQDLIDQTIAEHGQLDYMFNNAGIAIQGEARDMTPEHWDRILKINLLSVIYGTTAAYQKMVEQGAGHIVNTASILGLIGLGLSVGYATTKHAIVGLSTSLRAEGAGLGVKVSVVCPGFVQTGLYNAATIVEADNKEFYDQVPFKRMDVNKAAKLIIKGVRRNKAIMVFPLHAKLMWWGLRFNQNALDKANYFAMRDFRKIRKEQ